MVFVFEQKGEKEIKIDIEKDYSSIHPNNITNFRVEEKLALSLNFIYPGGILPGMTKVDETQIAYSKRFTNFFEFCKIVDDEIENIDKKSYLLSKFFDRREIGWRYETKQDKKGKAVGFYFDGKIWNIASLETIKKIFKYAYESVIKSSNELAEICKIIQTNVNVEIICKPIYFADIEIKVDELLKEIVLSKVQEEFF